jgi:colanic acid biosynthesis glycosyl transferase WcaI
MKVLLLTPHYLPEIRSVSVLMSQLADDLAAAGHHVTVLTPYPPANMAEAKTGSVATREQRGRVRILRVQVPPFVKVAPVVRALTHFTLAAGMALAGFREGRHDVMIAYSPPLTLALACEILGRWWRAPYILNVQDVYPQALIDLGLARHRAVVAVLNWLERRAYRHAAAVTVHSQGNRALVAARGVPDEKITVVHNWIDTTETVPGPRRNGYRDEFGLGNAFVVLFAGVMGYAQDMAVMIDAARALRDEQDIVFLLVGDGVRRGEAEELVRARGLPNVRFGPFQPVERYPLLLAAADCCLATLQASVATPVVPSKIAGIMAAGRPVVAALPQGDARALVEESGGGICVAPGDGAALAAAVRRLARDPDLCRTLGEAGRMYVEAHYARGVATSAYDRLIRRVATPVAAMRDISGRGSSGV